MKVHARCGPNPLCLVKVLLRDDRYTKERPRPTDQWTLSGRHVLIGVDTRSLRDLREDAPN